MTRSELVARAKLLGYDGRHGGKVEATVRRLEYAICEERVTNVPRSSLGSPRRVFGEDHLQQFVSFLNRLQDKHDRAERRRQKAAARRAAEEER